MKLRTKFRYVWLPLALWLCAGSLLSAGEYESLLGRHATKRRAGTQAKFAADLLILGRSGVDSVDIIFSDPSGGPRVPLLNTTDLDFNAAVSGRYDLVLTDPRSIYELQFTLTGFPDERISQERRTDDDIVAEYFGGQSVSDPLSPTESFRTRYESKFGSGEVNVRRRLGPRVLWFSGFRYIALQEDIDFIIDASNRGLFASADNALYGLQIGAESTVWSRGRAHVDIVGRCGIFYNEIEVADQYSSDPSDPAAVVTDKRQTDRSTFASDLQATLFVPLGPGSLRLGYQIFYVDKAALLPDQFDSINFAPTAPDPGDFDLSSPIYQGGFIGFEMPF